ncbi:hypothetical protein JQ607_13195 [Bradyrhizobium liaoningense]|nr:hypothetical protein [Bradyrhizobium liaoningense]
MKQMLRIRLVIADRRPIVLQGFAPLFAAEGDFEIVAACNNGADCLDAVRRLTPDVALVEDGFSDVTTSEMLAAVNTENLPTRLVFYTASIARGDLAAAIAAGACAGIPMREEPDALMQALRLVAPAADRVAARKASHGTFGDNGLTALTDLERKIMRLVACGMSNKEIARHLKVATGTINARVDHLSAQLEIKNRRELATFALSRLYGGIGALAALIWAVLDDAQPASAGAVDHAYPDTVTVTTADDTGAAVTIKLSPQKTTTAPGRTARAVGKAGRVENSVADSPTRASKLIESRADIAPSAITLPTTTTPRLGLSSFGTFVLMAIGVSIYQLLASPAQAFTFSESPSDFLASDAANATSEFAALNIAGGVDANLNGFDNPAWLNSEIHSGSFVFEGARGDAVGRGDEFQIIDAAVNEDSKGSGNPHVGAGALDALVDHGGLEQAGGTDPSRSAECGTIQATEVEGSNHGQSQRDFHVSEEGAAKGKPHPQHESPGQDPTQRQSQRELHVSEEGAAKGKPHAEHGPPERESDRGQLHGDVDASKEASEAGKKHVKDDALGSHGNSHKSQPDLHKAHSNASENLHASENAGGNNQATDDSGPTQTAAAPELGDSFHFKNDVAEAKHSDHLPDNHGPHADENGLHNAGHTGLALIQDADLIAPSHAEQSAVDHARGVEHHPTHDLLV